MRFGNITEKILAKGKLPCRICGKDAVFVYGTLNKYFGYCDAHIETFFAFLTQRIRKANLEFQKKNYKSLHWQQLFPKKRKESPLGLKDGIELEGFGNIRKSTKKIGREE